MLVTSKMLFWVSQTHAHNTYYKPYCETKEYIKMKRALYKTNNKITVEEESFI